MSELITYYHNQFFTLGFTGLVAKLPLVIGLYLVATGVRRPGTELLSAALILHFLLAGYFALSQGGAAYVLLLVALAGLGAVAAAWATKAADWEVLPAKESLHLLVIATYLIIILIPVYAPWFSLRAMLYSPMALIPQQTIACLALLAANHSKKNLAVFVFPTALSCGLVLAIMDGIAGVMGSSIFLLVVNGIAFFVWYMQRSNSDEPGGLGDHFERSKRIERATQSEDTSQSGSGRKWDIR